MTVPPAPKFVVIDQFLADDLVEALDAYVASDPVGRAVFGRFPDIIGGAGVPSFDVARIETEICAQRPGSYFAKHIDTDTREARSSLATDRLISAVYYFPRERRSFGGGELILYDFTGQGEAARIEPVRNRLVAFPSFAVHEVTPNATGDERLAGARWSVNCWLHRARPESRP